MTGPDRIWILPTHGAREPDDYFLLHPDYRNGRGSEYVRRDPAVLAALPEVQAMIAAAIEVAARETLTLALAIVTDIASTLLSVGDAAGANGLCVLIKTLEQHADTIPKSVSDAITPADATAALARIVREAEARGMRRAAAIALRKRGEGDTPEAILARAAEIEKDGK